jgi:serine protease Do
MLSYLLSVLTFLTVLGSRVFLLTFIFTFLFNFFISFYDTNSFLAKAQPLSANAFIDLAKMVNPAVVNISTSVTPRGFKGPRDPFFEMLEQFYGFRLQPKVKPQTALGTGFVIREDGLIITNNHVIAGADKVQVQFEEKGKSFEAKVLGGDERSDIALIKIEGQKFPTLKLGQSSEVQVGEWVAAFGNPFGNGHTMTKGIISAKGRDLSEINKFPLLQTDAPINPGNSGGPLVNLKGEVIGVNSAIDARAQGIGFAIPIDGVKNLIPQLEKTGHLQKGYLGVGLADIDGQTSMILGIPEGIQGSIISQVESGSPAHKAGLLPYDIVTEFNGRKIMSSNELRDSVADAEIGKTVTIKFLREGKERTTKVNITERPHEASFLQNRSSKKSLGTEAPLNLGFSASDMTPELRKEFQLPGDVTKPIIVGIVPGSPAARSGLLTGDVILDVNKKEVKSLSDLQSSLKKGMNTLRVFRSGSVLFLMLKSE